MRSEEYKKSIVEKLLKKCYDRKEGSNRRPMMKPKEVYELYKSNKAVIAEKKAFEIAAKQLAETGLIQVTYDRYGYNIEKLMLEIEKIHELEVLAGTFGIKIRSEVQEEMKSFLPYKGIDERIDRYIDQVQKKYQSDPQKSSGLKKEIDIVKAASFLCQNKDELYEREASAILFGETKVFEKIRDNVLSLLEEDSLDVFNIMKTDNYIHICGNAIIRIHGTSIDIGCLDGGMGISSTDIDKIEQIKINEKNLLTIENKTSFNRYHPKDTVTIFLSGFATGSQIAFLKKVIEQNQNVRFQHFGDIDVGGFLILDHLEKELGLEITPHHMDETELEILKSSQYKNCLQHLTENDKQRISSISEKHKGTVEYIVKHNVKLEQEILSLIYQKER